MAHGGPRPSRRRRKHLLHHLGVARSGMRTAGRSGDEAAVAAARGRVRLAKTGLGERGPA